MSCRELPEPDPDAGPLSGALIAAGITAEVLAWDDPDVDWSKARLTVLRSSWNYPLHLDAFVEWARVAARESQLWNPLPIVVWNAHKRYLLELAQRDIPVAPTVLVARGSGIALEAVLEARGWRDVVVKPAVSAASYRTRRFATGAVKAGETHLRALAADGDVLIQPYLPSVEDYGERSLIWIDGVLTHAVRKSPRLDGQAESVSEAVEIMPAEATLARRVIGSVQGPIMYGRIDMAPDRSGEPVLMELELLEPSLFFPQCPRALDCFVAAIRRRLDAG